MTHILLAKPSAALAKKHSFWGASILGAPIWGGGGIWEQVPIVILFYMSKNFSRRFKTYPGISFFY
jgi:hypothetical protein